MRCDNCGWNNPDNLEKCQKCNQDLRPVIAEVQKINEPEAIEQPSAPKVFKETTLDAERFMAANNKAVKPSVCPECCYPLMPDTDVCPNCGRYLTILLWRSLILWRRRFLNYRNHLYLQRYNLK